MLRFSLPSYDWGRLVQMLPGPLQAPHRLGLIASLGFHGLLFLTVLIPAPPEPTSEIAETVDIVTLSPEQTALLPSLTPLVPDELPSLSQTIAGLGEEFALPPVSFDTLPPLPPLPALTPLPNFSQLPPPIYAPFPPLVTPPRLSQSPSLPPTIRTLPDGPSDVAVAPDLVAPSPNETPNAVTSPTDDQQALSGLSRWISQARSSINGAVIGLNFTAKLEPPYPAGACGDQLQGRVAVAVLVTPEGRLASTSAASGFSQNPQLIRSSGHALLDQVAVRTVAAQTFSGGNQYQAMLYTLDFVYNPAVCGQPPRPETSPTPENSPTPTASPTGSTPTPSPILSPESSPTPQNIQPSPEATPTPTETPQPPTPSPSPENSGV
ncbi:energy transducer TonB [Synechococcus sp. PCC 6312]|uniref:energy transducer TonB n=1 Tax=Synechococcus sp. (strain ATCC 27167 / PCC 6312) TaxID=195253 RepID=UPI00029F3B08|nr:Gram-negative bacterial tonB protein [Synechococcus sp. PCC 6312]AFY62269.1 Gram-negative bacterial tonB protein [Synechococcus sp. PCC 6312]